MVLPILRSGRVVDKVRRVDLETAQVCAALKSYEAAFGAYPAGDSSAVFRALRGQNPRQMVFLDVGTESASADGAASRHLPRLPGWNQHILGAHPSDHGYFDVEVTSGPDDRVHAVFLSHLRSANGAVTCTDSERRNSHDAVMQTDLRGQREFSWGDVQCRYDTCSNRDWLVIAYKRGVHMTRPAETALPALVSREDFGPVRLQPVIELGAVPSWIQGGPWIGGNDPAVDRAGDGVGRRTSN